MPQDPAEEKTVEVLGLQMQDEDEQANSQGQPSSGYNDSCHKIGQPDWDTSGTGVSRVSAELLRALEACEAG